MRRSIVFGISMLSLLASANIVDAAEPAQADFDACNKDAAAKTENPSAAPRTGEAGTAKSGTPVSPSTAPSSPAPVTPSPAPKGRTDAGPGTPVSPSKATTSSPSDVSRGMAAAGQSDPAFRLAYTECMGRRGFSH
jgi:hypothetical protein